MNGYSGNSCHFTHDEYYLMRVHRISIVFSSMKTSSRSQAMTMRLKRDNIRDIFDAGISGIRGLSLTTGDHCPIYITWKWKDRNTTR